jgi:hypothetical protein
MTGFSIADEPPIGFASVQIVNNTGQLPVVMAEIPLEDIIYIGPIINSVVSDPASPFNHLESTVVQVNATDDVSVTYVTIKWPNYGPFNMTPVGSGLWNYTIPGQLAETNFNVTVTAYDEDNWTAVDSIYLNWVDQTAPTMGPVTLEPASPDHMDSVDVEVEVSDLVGVTQVTIDYGQGAFDMDDGPGILWNYTIPPQPALTSLDFTVTAYDAAGNFATYIFTIDWVDQTAPTIINVVNVPESPLEHMEATEVWVDAFDNVAVTNVTIELSDNGPFNMTLVGGLWNYTIPGQYAGTTLNVNVTVYDAANHNDTATLIIEWAPLQAFVDFDPDTLRLSSTGEWITAYISPPEGFDVNDIDRETILLNVRARTFIPSERPTALGDTLMVKFWRAEVIHYLETENILGKLVFTVTGELLTYGSFEASDTIRVK